MRGWIFAALVAAGCMSAPPQEQAQAQTQPQPTSGSVAAPVPDDVTVRIGVEQNGQTVEVPVGATFAILLVGVPTAGYRWMVVNKPDFVSDVSEATGPTTQAQRRPGFVGGSHWETFVLKADGAGEGAVRLDQRRPWESAVPPNASFSVTIVAR